MVRGDSAAAQSRLAEAARQAPLGFPQGQTATRTRASRKSGCASKPISSDAPKVLVAELTEQADGTASTYGGWSGPPSRPPSKPWPDGYRDHLDPAALSPHIGTMTTLLDTLRAFELKIYGTFFDAVLGPGC